MADVVKKSEDGSNDAQKLTLCVVNIAGEEQRSVAISGKASILELKDQLALKSGFRMQHQLLLDGCILEDRCSLVESGVSNDSTLTHIIDSSCLTAVSPGSALTAMFSHGWLKLVRNEDDFELGCWNLCDVTLWTVPESVLQSQAGSLHVKVQASDEQVKLGAAAVLDTTQIRFSEEVFEVFLLTTHTEFRPPTPTWVFGRSWANPNHERSVSWARSGCRQDEHEHQDGGKFYPPHFIFDPTLEYVRIFSFDECDSSDDELEDFSEPVGWIQVKIPGDLVTAVVPTHPKWTFRRNGVPFMTASRHGNWAAGKLMKGCSFRKVCQHPTHRNADGTPLNLPLTTELFAWLGDQRGLWVGGKALEVQEDPWVVLTTPLFMEMREAMETDRLRLEDRPVLLELDQ